MGYASSLYTYAKFAKESEIDDIRKTVVSMSVGQPGRTSTIVKEWLEQPAPAPPEPEEKSGDGDEDDEE